MSAPHSELLRIGIIGCGIIARNHAEAFNAHPHAQVVAVSDIDKTRAAAFAAQHGIENVFDDVAALLASGVDAVAVCTPHPTHEALVIQAARAGKHVLCEKPIATTIEAAEAMVAACEDAGVLLGVMFQRRFWPAAQELKAKFRDGTILGRCDVALHRDHSYYTKDAWRGTWAADGGGVLMTQAIHYIDLLQWVMGDVVEVNGRINSFKHADNIEVEDSAVATLVFASGALATLNASTSVTPSLGVRVQVTGADGSTAALLEFPEGSEGRLVLDAAGGIIAETPEHPRDLNPNVDLATINGQLIPYHTKQIANFVDAVRGEAELVVDGREGTKALQTLLAVYESHRTGAPVRLSSDAPPSRVSVPETVTATAAAHVPA